jgi:hypothetical protein
MRLALSLVALTALVLPVAGAHVILCMYDTGTKQCEEYSMPGPHSALFLAPCGPCAHVSQAALRVELERVLP